MNDERSTVISLVTYIGDKKARREISDHKLLLRSFVFMYMHFYITYTSKLMRLYKKLCRVCIFNDPREREVSPKPYVRRQILPYIVSSLISTDKRTSNI